MRKVLAFMKNHWLFLCLYAIIFLAIFICVNLAMNSEVEESENDIKRYEKNYFGDDKGICVRDKTTYTIVSYKLAEKPSPEGEDSSIYAQMYGSFDRYYVATNKPWDIVQYIYEYGELKVYSINPCAVGIKGEYSTPEQKFDDLYDKIYEGYNVNGKYHYTPEDCRSSYHYLKRESRDFTDTLFYAEYSEKLFFTKKWYASYYVKEDTEKILFDTYTRIFGFILLETLLFALFWYLRKKLKGKSFPSFSNLKDKVSSIKPTIVSKSKTSDDSVSDTEYEVLLHKINPINFMNPYDAEKVKIANDLYSALLKSRDNETIIRMIEEKAKTDLKI